MLSSATPATTLDDLTAAVPKYAACDIDQQMRLAEGPFAAFRALPQTARVCSPVFAGSSDIGGADADYILGGLLPLPQGRPDHLGRGRLPAAARGERPCAASARTAAPARARGGPPGGAKAPWRPVGSTAASGFGTVIQEFTPPDGDLQAVRERGRAPVQTLGHALLQIRDGRPRVHSESRSRQLAVAHGQRETPGQPHSHFPCPGMTSIRH